MNQGDEFVSSHKESEDNGDTNDNDNNDLLISKLPSVANWSLATLFNFNYQGFWYHSPLIPPIIKFQRHFQAQEQDIILASRPKSGTTWLKALLFSVVNRAQFTLSDTPLLTSNPHTLVPYFELMLYSSDETPDLSRMDPPRLFSTHLPYSALPESIKTTCRLVYVCRNPLDTFASFWHFAHANNFVNRGDRDESRVMEDYADSLCAGNDMYGPHWEHVLGYWKESLVNPEKVLFLKYEDMKENVSLQVKRLAEFVGVPFSEEEEKDGVVGRICDLCSLSSLKGLQAKKKAEEASVQLAKDTTYFREGKVGNWAATFSPSVVERLGKVMHEKFQGSGLEFNV